MGNETPDSFSCLSATGKDGVAGAQAFTPFLNLDPQLAKTDSASPALVAPAAKAASGGGNGGGGRRGGR
jgi:hypothetical protein